MPAEKTTTKEEDGSPGVALEMLVARIQQMMDPNTTVTHNEKLEDRVGNKRQYDVVIRGQFGGRPILGVMECKDHNRKKGPDSVEAFAKKTENLGANVRVIVSKRGFTKQALKLAEHENIGCFSLLPKDPGQVGFSIGEMWYGVMRLWTNVRLTIHFATPPTPLATFSSNSVKWNGKEVGTWFIREFLTKHGDVTKEGEYTIELKFDQVRLIEVEGKEYPVTGFTCTASLVNRKKKKWVSWSGDAFYDWHTGRFTIPAKGTLVGSAVESDLSAWKDYEGEIPDAKHPGFIRAVLYNIQKWDEGKNHEVPDLSSL